MNENLPDKELPEGQKSGRLKRFIIPVLALTLIFAIVFGVFYFYKEYPEKVESLKEYGYFGAFLISIALNATVVLPAGNFLVLAALGAALPSPTLVGVVGGLGAAIGELTGYFAGYSGQNFIKKNKLYLRLEKWLKRWGSPTIFVLSIAPLFFDVAGLVAGVLRFPLWKFFIACLLGRTILYVLIAWAGALGWDYLLNLLD